MRTIVASHGVVALAEPADGDREALRDGADGLFTVDPDPRPLPFSPPAHWLAVIDADSGELLGDVAWVPGTTRADRGVRGVQHRHRPAACRPWSWCWLAGPTAAGRALVRHH